jgi:hypothetical protein
MIHKCCRAALWVLLCFILCVNPRTALAGLNPFLGEVETFAFGFCPVGWSTLNGQLLPIRQNTALFSLLGMTYGGDGSDHLCAAHRQTSLHRDRCGSAAVHRDARDLPLPELNCHAPAEAAGHRLIVSRIRSPDLWANVSLADRKPVSCEFPSLKGGFRQ